MNHRFREVRIFYNLTQKEFAERIGLKASTIASYECGARTLTDIVIQAICREYQVNEHWLRTGEGSMIRHRSRDEDLARFFGQVLRGEETFKRRFISVLSRLTPEEWEMLEARCRELVAEDPDEQ